MLRPVRIAAALILTSLALHPQGARYDAIQAANCVPPPAGMVAWWRSEDDAGDEVGGHDGSLVGDTTFAQGEVGRAFLFDGNGDWVSVTDDDAWAFGKADFTLDAWIYRSTGAGGDLTIVGQSGDASNWWRFGISSGGRLKFQASAGIGPPAISVTSIADAFSDEAWHHVAVTRVGITDWAFYHDGELLPPDLPQNVGVVVLDGAAPDLSAPLAIGQMGNPPLSFKGRLDEIEIFHRALAQSEVRAISDAGAAGKCIPEPEARTRRNPGGAIAAVAAAADQARDNRGPAASLATAGTQVVASRPVTPPSTGDGGLAGR